MPKFADAGAEGEKLPNDNYGYSHVGLAKLASAEYTLVTVVCDTSGSVEDFVKELRECVKKIVGSCKYSQRADSLMLRVVTFDDDVHEMHGFKLLSDCNPDDYEGIYTGGATALFDASANSINATTDFAKKLSEQEYAVNAVAFVITDGDNNRGTLGVKSVAAALKNATKSEALESCVSVLIGVHGPNDQDQDVQRVKQYLDDFHKEAGFTQYIHIGLADAKKLAKLADFVSKSISSQSQALGSGAASKPLTF